MPDWAIYWRDYANESGFTGKPVVGWFTHREWFVRRLRAGDRLWLFVAGEACGDLEHPYRGYVAQLLVVDKTREALAAKPETDTRQEYEILGQGTRCVLVRPPLLADAILRQPESKLNKHIGVARQTPFALSEVQAARLLAMLLEHAPTVHAAAVE